MRIKIKKSTKALAAGVATALVLAACGGGSGTPAGGVEKGETLVIADETQPLSGLDPIMAQAHDAKRIVSQLYEGLLRLGADGITIEPALATK